MSLALNVVLFNTLKKMRMKIRALTPRYDLDKHKATRVDFNRVDLEFIDSLDGLQFEQLCCEILNLRGYINIHKTKVTGDFGLDILCDKDGERYGIQCKCYSSPIGVHAVQEAFSGSAYYDCDIPVVITNQSFTYASQEMARKLGVTLWDRDFLVRELSTIKRKKLIRKNKKAKGLL